MKQKREIIISLSVADNISSPLDADELGEVLAKRAEEVIGPTYMDLVIIDEEWGDPV